MIPEKMLTELNGAGWHFTMPVKCGREILVETIDEEYRYLAKRNCVVTGCFAALSYAFSPIFLVPTFFSSGMAYQSVMLSKKISRLSEKMHRIVQLQYISFELYHALQELQKERVNKVKAVDHKIQALGVLYAHLEKNSSKKMAELFPKKMEHINRNNMRDILEKNRMLCQMLHIFCENQLLKLQLKLPLILARKDDECRILLHFRKETFLTVLESKNT